jgi:hypothetical protein
MLLMRREFPDWMLSVAVFQMVKTTEMLPNFEKSAGKL